MRRCPACEQEKSLSEFTRRASYCKPCMAARSREWRAANPDKHRAAKRRWEREHREQHLAMKRRERERHLEVTRKRNREYERTHREGANQRSKRYRERHPDEVRERVAVWHTRRKGAFIEHVQPIVVLERSDGVCGICGQDVDPTTFDIDHIVPLSRGGLHNYENTQAAHPTCNRAKGARVLAA